MKLKLTKKIMGLTLLLAFAFSVLSVAASEPDLTVTIDGVQVTFDDQQPVIVGDRTLVPVRGVFEELGFDVEWCPDEATVTLTDDDHEVIIAIGSPTFTTNGVAIPLDVPAQIIGERTLLPLRHVVESVGFFIDFEPATRVVFILTTPPDDNGDDNGVEPTPTPPPAFTLADLGINIELIEVEDMEDFADAHLFDYYQLRASDLVGHTLLISAAVNLYDVVILDIRPNMVDEISYYEIDDLFAVADVVLPLEGIIVENFIGVGTHPFSAISFLDEHGARWYFLIFQDQSDEFPPYRLIEVRDRTDELPADWSPWWVPALSYSAP